MAKDDSFEQYLKPATQIETYPKGDGYYMIKPVTDRTKIEPIGWAASWHLPDKDRQDIGQFSTVEEARAACDAHTANSG